MPSSWTQPIDLYCERTDASFWAEPVNAATNIAFLLAAVWAFMLWRRNQVRDWATLALIVVTGTIGIGSFAFHTIATRGAVLLDVVPIVLFIYGYLFLALRRYLQLPIRIATAVLILFALALRGVAYVLPGGVLNGSGEYLLPLLALVVVGSLAPRPQGGSIVLAAAVFAGSLVFRTIDQAVCPAFSLGTHFLWHLLNAAVLFILLRVAVRFPDPKPGT